MGVSGANEIIDECIGIRSFIAKLVDQVLPDLLAGLGISQKARLEVICEILERL